MSFSDPFQPNLPNYHHPAFLDDAVAGAEFVRASAFSAHGPTSLYDPAPGTSVFPESKYRLYQWESLVDLTPPFRAPLPLEPEPEKVPDYNATLAAGEVVRQELTGRAIEGQMDPVLAELVRYFGTSPETEATQQSGGVMFRAAPEIPVIQPSGQVIQEIETAIDHAKLPLEPEYPPFWDGSGF